MRAVIALALSLCACGARTELPVYGDASVDRSDAPYGCVSGSFALRSGAAELVLVLDRSGSMSTNLDGVERSPPRKWDDLRRALATTLPEFQSRLAVGAMAYPRRFDGSNARSCEIRLALDIEPALGTAPFVDELLAGTDPWGGTPTSAAIDFVGTMLTSRLARERTEAIVLATDGGPNCNSGLDANTCVCSAPPLKTPPCDEEPQRCLDDKRTVDTLARFAAKGIPTFVIGLDSALLTVERGALEAMARAGGRPRTGATPYYSVRDPGAVVEAFRTVQRSVVACRRFMPTRPDDPDAVSVEVSSARVPRDRAHIDGWDWASVDYGQIDFFGAACDRLIASGAEPIGVVTSCR